MILAHRPNIFLETAEGILSGENSTLLRIETERDLPVLLIHRDPAPILQPAEEQFLCQGLPLDPIPTVLEPKISSEATRNKIPISSLYFPLSTPDS